MMKSTLASLPLFSSKNIIMLLIDPEDGLLIDANRGAIDFYGYEYDELMKLHIQDINILASSEIEAEMQRAKEESRNYFVFRHRKANGSIASVEVHSEPIKDGGKEYLFSVIMDMTAHQQLMGNYVDVLKRYQTIFNHARDMIFLIKADDKLHPEKILEVNQRALEVLKYSEEEIISGGVQNLVNASTLEKFSYIGSELIQTGQSSFYADVLDKYEEKVPLYITTTIMEYENDQIIVAVARDMSAEFELQLDRDIQENYYRTLFSKNPSSIFLVDRENTVCDYNTSVHEQLMSDAKIVIGKSIVDILNEMNFSRVILEDIIEKGWSTPGYKDVIVGKSSDDLPKYLEVVFIPFELADQSIKSYIILNDITILVEETQKRDMLSTVFSNNSEGVLIADAQMRIEWVNQSFEYITGYSFEDVIGNTPSLLKSTKHSKKFYKTMMDEIELNGTWTGEIWNRKKNGEVGPVQLNIFTMEDDIYRQVKYIGIISDIAKIKEQEEKILELIYVDPLTQLRNRSFFINELESRIRHAITNSEGFSVIYIDLDNFKMLNDTMGHTFGDEVLIKFAIHLKQVFGDRSLVGRIGGDEFTVLLKETESGKIDVYLNTLIDKLSASIFVKEKAIRVLFSAGIAQFPKHGTSAETLLKNADIAMYRAKKISGSGYQYYADQFSENMAKELYIENLVLTGIEQEEFYLEYQPIISREEETIVGIEALIRWNTEDNGLIRPNEFIPICEKNGTIKELGRWILERSIRDIILINSALNRELFISINVSTVQLFDDGLVSLLKGLLEEEGVSPHLIELEITETAYMEDFNLVKDVLSQIKQLGVKLVIDDFGTGYSSFNQLIKLEVDKLKIDQSFILEVENSEKYLNLVSGILSMADNLNIAVVCEGIEFQGQLKTMFLTNWQLGQGYLFSRPKKIGSLIKDFDEIVYNIAKNFSGHIN